MKRAAVLLAGVITLAGCAQTPAPVPTQSLSYENDSLDQVMRMRDLLPAEWKQMGKARCESMREDGTTADAEVRKTTSKVDEYLIRLQVSDYCPELS